MPGPADPYPTPPAPPTPPGNDPEPPTAAASGGESPQGGARPDRPLPNSDDPTLGILEALARGEISVDEAQSRLNQRR